MELLLFIAAPFVTALFGFALQLIKAEIMEIVYWWEKKHAKREDQWVYKI